jgi:hypothetical protein
VTVSQIPADAEAVAGYTSGLFPTWSLLVQAFPNAKRLSIAVNAEQDADCLDIENGDARPDQAAAWHARQRARGVLRPCLYADTSTMPAVVSALTAAGIGRNSYRLWTAHFTDVPHIEAGSDATQWTDHALGRNLDSSLCVPSFFDEAPVKPTSNAAHYNWFPNRRFMIFGAGYMERTCVKQYDRLRRKQTRTSHPNRAELAVLRKALGLLAGRVYRVAHSQLRNGKPSWATDKRGWRFQELSHRAQGQRCAV